MRHPLDTFSIRSGKQLVKTNLPFLSFLRDVPEHFREFANSVGDSQGGGGEPASVAFECLGGSEQGDGDNHGQCAQNEHGRILQRGFPFSPLRVSESL